MTQRVFSVPDISCDHCKHSIEAALSKLKGVSRVEVKVETKTVEVEFDEGELPLDRIRQAIEDQGYRIEGS